MRYIKYTFKSQSFWWLRVRSSFERSLVWVLCNLRMCTSNVRTCWFDLISWGVHANLFCDHICEYAFENGSAQVVQKHITCPKTPNKTVQHSQYMPLQSTNTNIVSVTHVTETCASTNADGRCASLLCPLLPEEDSFPHTFFEGHEALLFGIFVNLKCFAKKWNWLI